jgi:MFS family permease
MSRRLPGHVVVLGVISFLTAMSSAMVYGLLPVFLVRVLGATMTAVGLIEGTAEGMMALTRILSGLASDWMGRRKPLVLVGYSVSAANKLLFPLAGAVSTVLAARVIDRMGKGLRDAPRDAFMTDVTPAQIRGSGFGLRLTFYTTGYFLGPLAAMALMAASGDSFRLVFWIAVIPAALAIIVLVFGIKETIPQRITARPLRLRRADLAQFTGAFWRAIAIASLLSLARFSHAFLILKASSIGIDAAYVPVMMILMHLCYAITAYPFGVLADHIDRRLQLTLGAGVLIGTDLVLASASVAWVAMAGAALWGLQMAITQGLLAASVADAAPVAQRGTAFGIYDLAVGAATFVASAAAGVLWSLGGPAWAFGFSALIGIAAIVVLSIRPLSGVAVALLNPSPDIAPCNQPKEQAHRTRLGRARLQSPRESLWR